VPKNSVNLVLGKGAGHALRGQLVQDVVANDVGLLECRRHIRRGEGRAKVGRIACEETVPNALRKVRVLRCQVEAVKKSLPLISKVWGDDSLTDCERSLG